MHSPIVPLDFYLLRLPARPISDVWQLHQRRTPLELAEALRAYYQVPERQEAIYLASPELYQELQKWLAYPAARYQPEDERLVLTLYKYLLRMSSRCTPYGLFAGFATGTVADEPTQWKLSAGPGQHYKHARLDMNYVAELSRQVLADPVIQANLTFFVNNSLYKAQNTYRYYECSLRHKQRHYYLVSVKASRYLDKLLAAAQPGATRAQLVAVLVAQEVTPEVAAAFVEQLVQAQILVSDLEPTVTGPEFYRHLVDRVAAISPEYRYLPDLQRVTQLLGAPDATVATYRTVQETVGTCFSTAAGSKDLIQVDLRLRMADNTLSQAAVGHLSTDLHALAALYKAAAPSDLQNFIQRFVERYEEQEIPLLEALDSEAGLGYGSATGAKANHAPLLQGLRMPGKPGSRKITWNAYRQLVFRKFQESHGSRRPVQISDEELAAVAAGNAPELPASFFAMGSFLAANSRALDQGEFAFHLIACHGPGAMTVLARFAHAEPALADKLAACGELEQRAYGEDAVLAEIVHLPEARIGNLLQRPRLRRYEIPFLGNASVPAEQQLPVADLLLSVREGQLVLRSKRLHKIVIPRLTTAHYYRDGLPIYKFLCDLQQQQPFSMLWDWGVLHEQPYLPRVEYKRIIVTRARWRLPRTAHAAVLALQTPEQVLAFREQYGLPERVLLADNDQELLLDFASPLAAALLAQALRKSPVLLYECLSDQGAALVQDQHEQPYLHEVVIPLTNPAAHRRRPVVGPPAAAAPPVQRTFALGSEWTYLKVYCGARWADKILTEHLLPCLAELEEKHVVQQWFFIRYNDPHSHLRLRLRHAPDAATLATILERLHQALDGLQQQRVVQAIQYDTYQRELERYGAATMSFSETVFCHDSRAVVRFLSLLEGDEGERYRWLFAVRGVDALLDDFGLSLTEKLRVAEQTQHSFFTEFHGTPALTRQLNDKYRAISRLLTDFLNPANDTDYIQDAVDLFAERSAAIRQAYAGMQEVFSEHYPSTSLPAAVRRLLPSYLHMFLNRIFIANQRLHELVVYHYLVKQYTSQLARAARPEPAAV